MINDKQALIEILASLDDIRASDNYNSNLLTAFADIIYSIAYEDYSILSLAESFNLIHEYKENIKSEVL
jgi:hypothetical protein